MKIKAGISENKNWLLAILSGFLLTLAFPKAGFWPVGWFALVPLLAAVKGLSFGKAFRTGFLAGLAHYLTLLYWLVYTMQTYGGLPGYLAVPVLFLLSAYMALYVGLFSAFISHLKTSEYKTYLLAIPVLWVFLEYLRGFLFTGFPWSFLGYSQFKQLNIIQVSDIFGVYAISFLLVLSSGVIFLTIDNAFSRKLDNQTYRHTNSIKGVIILIFLLTATLSYGKWRISSIEERISSGPFLQIAVVQGNIDQAIKWDPSFQVETTEKYIRLSLSAQKHKPDLVVWPETATPFYFLSDTVLSQKVIKTVFEMGTDFLIGSPSFKIGENTIEYYNSAYLIDAGSKVINRYDKVHLVPFGEYVPFKKWLPFLGKMVEQVGDFKPGTAGNTLSWNERTLGIQICFEIIYPGLSRAMVQNGADFLINITNDAWFEKTSAPYQHFSMTIFRAIENRRSLVRAANTGISGFVDPVGNIMGQTELFHDTVLSRDIPIYNELSIYTRFGDFFAVICSLISVFLIGLSFTKSKQRV